MDTWPIGFCRLNIKYQQLHCFAFFQIVDVIFQRALEVQVVPGVLEILLRHFAHLYRLHRIFDL